ncbi:MAG: hypothetical protein EB121_01520 [Alphaproteobacteria bacterium]|nr:hypothetical protein [Alphaproteobacteria bacterium]
MIVYLDQDQVYGGVTTPALGGLGAVSNAQIAAFVAATIPGPDPVEVKAKKLVAYMQANQLTPERVAMATGYPLKTVNDVIAMAGPQFNLATIAFAIGAYLLLGF